MEKTFEEYLQELEMIVKKLENKEINLDEAVKNYHLGINLSKLCYDKLKENEKLVITKMTENGEVEF